MNRQQAGRLAGRRGFLKGVAATGGSAVLAGVFASGLVPHDPGATAARKPEPRASRGYRETDHIREYYRTLRS
jgi:hypothetical protein